MNDHDLFQLILDQPEPDFPSVVDAAVEGGRRARRRRRMTMLGAGAAVLAIAGAGLLLVPSNPQRVGPAAPVPPAATVAPSRPTPDPAGPSVDATSSAKPEPRPEPAQDPDGTPADAPGLPEETPTSTEPENPPRTSTEYSRTVGCLATRTGKCPSTARN
ncbi:hypothetical protein [Embleya sp. NPDC050493]|uniref:hypothetical protein n=1 Tax=Embleya sp. NPDC050493 TaxID=3363989 RepID=UPI0037A97389